MLKQLSAVLASGIMLGLSQPLVVSYTSQTPLDSTGLTGLLAFVGYIPLFLALRRSGVAAVFAYAFATSMIQYGIILYWIFVPIHVFGHVDVIPSAAITMLLAAETSFFIGAGVAVGQLLHRRLAWPLWLTYTLCLCTAEYARNYLPFGGFPWGNVGSSLASVAILRQMASVVGVYGLVFIVVLVNGAIASLWIETNKRSRIIAVSFASLLLIGMSVFGLKRIQEFSTASTAESVTISLLQGNVEQGIKNKQSLYAGEILKRYESLQSTALEQGAEIVVWPEGAFPLLVQRSAQDIPALREATVPTIVGASVYGPLESHGNQGPLVYSNSALALLPGGKIIGRYDKRHLVPFGEYVPWPFKGIVSKVVPGVGSWQPGNSYDPIKITTNDGKSIMAGITICYEGVFPEISRALANNGAQLLININNDAWYGVSSATYQHLIMYGLRSVETGRYYARATNTGVSAFVDPTGKIYDTTRLFEQALITKNIPLVNTRTIYAQVGDIVPQMCAAIVFLALTISLLGKNFIARRRRGVDWVLGIGGILIFVFAVFSLFGLENSDEKYVTQFVALATFATNVFFGALSDKKWGSTLLIWTGALACTLGLMLAFLEGVPFLIFAGLGATVFVAGMRRLKRY